MRLYYSPTSPYVRKVMACALVRGIAGQIELITLNPHESPPQLLADNPLSKVPCLVTNDGLALCDSTVICEYLDSVEDTIPLFPPSGPARWRARSLHALADGLMDAAVLARMESQRPREDARDKVIARQRAAIGRTLDVLERDPPSRHMDIGSIAVACALGYLDFRHADLAWRDQRPKLAQWYQAIAEDPALVQTAPK